MVDGVVSRHRRGAQAGRKRERDRRAREQAALRAGFRRGRVDQRGLGRALQPAPAQLHRPHHPARRSGVLRHHPLGIQRLPHVLLPHVQRGLRDPGAKRRLQNVPRVDRPLDRFDPSGRDDRRRRARLAEGRRVRVLQRDGSLRSAVRPRARAALHERPVISRLNSIDHPIEIKEGMVFALETYCPAKDGFSAARIEEEIVVTVGRARDHHALSGARTLHRQRLRLRRAAEMSDDIGQTSRSRKRRASRCTNCSTGCACSRSAPTICSCRTWSRARAISRSVRKPSRRASRPRCGATTGRSARTAATITRSRAA